MRNYGLSTYVEFTELRDLTEFNLISRRGKEKDCSFAFPH